MKRILTTLALSLTALAGMSFAADKYPLETCVVSGEKLGSMGKPYVHKHEGREVQFCCKGCIKTFDKDPAKYLSKIDAAQAAQK